MDSGDLTVTGEEHKFNAQGVQHKRGIRGEKQEGEKRGFFPSVPSKKKKYQT